MKPSRPTLRDSWRDCTGAAREYSAALNTLEEAIGPQDKLSVALAKLADWATNLHAADLAQLAWQALPWWKRLWETWRP